MSHWPAPRLPQRLRLRLQREDGEIAAYAMQPDGTLKALARTQVAKTVMRCGEPDRRLLYAASRSSLIRCTSMPSTADGRAQGPVHAPLAESFPYILARPQWALPLRRSYGGTS